MILQNLNVVADDGYHREREFNISTQTVTDLYLGSLGRFKTDGIAKVVLKLTGGSQPAARPQKLLNVLVTTRQFDFERYWTLPEEERKAQILELIHEELALVGVARHWDVGSLERAYGRALKMKLKNAQTWTKTARSPNGSLIAHVEYDFGVETIEGYVVFSRPNGKELAKRHIFSLPAVDAHLYDALGALSWSNDRTVVLRSKSGSHVWKAECVEA